MPQYGVCGVIAWETCFLINRLARVALDRKVAEEVLTDSVVDYFDLRVSGCLVYMMFLVKRD